MNHTSATVLSGKRGIGPPQSVPTKVGGCYGGSDDEDFEGFRWKWLQAEREGGCVIRKSHLAISSLWLWQMTTIQCRRRVHSQDVEDTTSETMLYIHAKVRRGSVVCDLDREARFRGWWVVIIQNSIRTVMQQRRTLEFVELDNQVPDRRREPEVTADDLLLPMSRLPDRRRKAVEERFFGDKSHREIADQLHVCTRTVRRDIRRGIEELRKNFDT